MLEALERIRGFSTGGRGTFLADLRTQEAVAYELLKLGEAANRVSKSFRRDHVGFPWKRLIDLRNEIVHEYFRVDPDSLWEFVEQELDELERKLRPLTATGDRALRPKSSLSPSTPDRKLRRPPTLSDSAGKSPDYGSVLRREAILPKAVQP
jgi:uncharacterized protein with HEPN domain